MQELNKTKEVYSFMNKMEEISLKKGTFLTVKFMNL